MYYFYDFIFEQQNRLISKVPDIVKQCFVKKEVTPPACDHTGACCLRKTYISAEQYCPETAQTLLKDYR